MSGERFIGNPDAGQEYWPTAAEQNKRFLQRAWNLRTPELLAEKVDSTLQSPPSLEIQRAYREQEAILTEIFGDKNGDLEHNCFFHGTGKYKYPGEKYLEGVDHDQTVPVLGEILKEGLNPHYDQWILDRDVNSTSLAKNYFYAKCYAVKNTEAEDELQWNLGDSDDYFIFFLADSILKELELKHLPQTALNFLQDMQKIRETKKGRVEQRGGKGRGLSRWFSGFRKDFSKFRDYNDLLDSRTDIPDNWGAVICIDNNINTFDMKYGGAHETRTEESLSPSKFKAIGVPFARMEEAQQMLDEAGATNIRLFALECADMHLASFPIKDLVGRIE